MGFPWSGFTKKRNYTGQKDRLQYNDLRNIRGLGPGKPFLSQFFIQKQVDNAVRWLKAIFQTRH
jgi:hypothetical protein